MLLRKRSVSRHEASRVLVLLLMATFMAGTTVGNAKLPPKPTIVVPVTVGGKGYGVIAIQVNPDGSITGGFQAGGGSSLSGMEQQLGQQHLNWLVVGSITGGPSLIDGQGSRISPPYIDPPDGGYGQIGLSPPSWADQIPWYWDEYQRPPLITDPELTKWTKDGSGRLWYGDRPVNDPGVKLGFDIFLISDFGDHTYQPIGGVHIGGTIGGGNTLDPGTIVLTPNPPFTPGDRNLVGGWGPSKPVPGYPPIKPPYTIHKPQPKTGVTPNGLP